MNTRLTRGTQVATFSCEVQRHGALPQRKGKNMSRRKLTVLQMPLSQLETDPVGDMLASSEGLKPYIDHYCALVQRRTGKSLDRRGNANSTRRESYL